MRCMSGWKVDGGIRQHLPSRHRGPGGCLYLSPNVGVFRARDPRAEWRDGLFVQAITRPYPPPWRDGEPCSTSMRRWCQRHVNDVRPARGRGASRHPNGDAGGNARLWVFASGAPPLSYQWQFHGMAVEGPRTTFSRLATFSLCTRANMRGGDQCLGECDERRNPG